MLLWSPKNNNINKGFIYAAVLHAIFFLSVTYIHNETRKSLEPRMKTTKAKIFFQKKIEDKQVVHEVQKKEKTKIKKKEVIKKVNSQAEKKTKQQPKKYNNAFDKVKKKNIQEDSIFSNIMDGKTIEIIAENDLLSIQEKVQNNWNLTSCIMSNTTLIRLQVIISGDCQLIYRNLLEGSVGKICSQSAIKAVRNVGKLNLAKEKCVEYSKSAITLTFNVPVDLQNIIK